MLVYFGPEMVKTLWVSEIWLRTCWMKLRIWTVFPSSPLWPCIVMLVLLRGIIRMFELSTLKATNSTLLKVRHGVFMWFQFFALHFTSLDLFSDSVHFVKLLWTQKTNPNPFCLYSFISQKEYSSKRHIGVTHLNENRAPRKASDCFL